MSAAYTLLSQSATTPVSLSIKKKENQSSLFGSFFSTRAQPESECNSTAPAKKVRGVVGADPGELSLRASMAKKKAFQIESFENGSYGTDGDDDTDEEEMEKEMQELRFFLQYECQDLIDTKIEQSLLQPVEGRERGDRKKSFAARLLSRGSQSSK
ncbi:MAG: hypothetical protein Q9226_002501 [Calogaya cf. arnoldii]